MDRLLANAVIAQHADLFQESCDSPAWELEEQGTGPLLHAALDLSPRQQGSLPPALEAALWALTRRERILAAAWAEELPRVLAKLNDAGVPTLVLKGAALAHSIYASPWLRPRCDTDLLVAPEHRLQAESVFDLLGYPPAPIVSGRAVFHQVMRTRRVGPLELTLDLHWRLGNREAFAKLFTFEELLAAAQALPALGSAARGLSAAHALCLACIHPAMHHANEQRLIWLFDIHLLIEDMMQEERRGFLQLVCDKGLKSVTASALASAAKAFGSHAAHFLACELQARQRHSPKEPTAAFIRPGRGVLAELFSDLWSMQSRSEQLLRLREVFFPSPDYMLRRYRNSSGKTRRRWLLPILYAQRLLLGWRRA